MAYGYVIVHVDVTAPEVYAEYKTLVKPTLDQFGGTFLVRGGQADQFEGTPVGDRHVIIQFPSRQAAINWYHSEEYADAKALRQSASRGILTIVEGV